VESEFTVRQRTPKDLTNLKRIIDLSFPRFFRFFALHSCLLEDGQVLVTEVQEKVVGFAN
jgi:hypothetical protein